MNGQTISWDESKPAKTDNVAQGDDQIRSDKTALRTALGDEHNFPSTGGANSGYHKFGSARPFYGAISACSSSGTVARLFQTSDTSEVYADTGAAVFPVGGLFSLLGANAAGVYTPTAGSKYAVQFGASAIDASKSSVGINYAGSGFSGIPMTIVTLYSTTAVLNDVILAVDFQTGSNSRLTVVRYHTESSALTAPATQSAFYWLSIGTVAAGTV